jgi:hypothetical protein
MIAIDAFIALVLLVRGSSLDLSAGEGGPALILGTELGTIEIALDPVAAAELGPALACWSQGPADLDRHFDFIHPHVEIRTSPLASVPELSIPVAMDAAALGLEELRLADAAEAMNVMQRELLPRWQRLAERGLATTQLRRWIEGWYGTYDPSFLIGVSWREINEALGYSYRTGAGSLQPERGSVALVPVEPGRASSRLAILLADRPELTGRWFVVGRVTSGLEIASTLSIQARADRGPSARLPLNPVRILSFSLRSGPSPSKGGFSCAPRSFSSSPSPSASPDSQGPPAHPPRAPG